MFLHIIFPSFFTETKVAKRFVGKDIYNGCFFDCVSYYSLNFVKQKFRLCQFWLHAAKLFDFGYGVYSKCFLKTIVLTFRKVTHAALGVKLLSHQC